MKRGNDYKLYEVIMEEEDEGVSAISLVTSPANKSSFIKLADDEPIKAIKLSCEDKMEVWGVVLQPEQKIYRNDNFILGECEICFKQDTIVKLESDFSKNKDAQGATIQHMFPSDDAYLLDSWISTENDSKLIELGLEAPVGSWLVGYKITDDKLWKSIKDGNLNGFSVEADAGFKELVLSEQLDDETILTEYILTLL